MVARPIGSPGPLEPAIETSPQKDIYVSVLETMALKRVCAGIRFLMESSSVVAPPLAGNVLVDLVN